MMWTIAAAMVLAQAAGADASGRPYFPATLPPPARACTLGNRALPPPVLTDFKKGWYARHLRAAGERSLVATRRSVVRFTWLRSFQAPVVVRVDGLAGGSPRLVARQLAGHGGYDPGTVARQVDRPLTGAEAATLRRVLATGRALAGDAIECDRLGADGAQWIVEGVDHGGYRFVERWSPETGPVRELGLAMIALTGWEVGTVY